MGAIYFSIERDLAKLLAVRLNISVFIETGTFQGDSAALVRNIFQEIHTCELSPELYANAVQRFKGDSEVHCHLGSSPDYLRSLVAKFAHCPVMYWLDAHWCASENTAGEDSQCPLLEELENIAPLHSNSIVWIDDARFFLAPPPAPLKAKGWPSFQQVLGRLQELSSGHQIVVANDTILCYPVKISKEVSNYLHAHGADWLAINHDAQLWSKAKNLNSRLHQDLQDKEKSLQDKEKSLQDIHQAALEAQKVAKDLDKDLQANERVVHNLLLERSAWRAVAFLFWPLQRIALWALKKKKTLTRVCLGKLRQHAPRPFHFHFRICPRPPDGLPTISLVTPSYNQGRFLRACLPGVISQGYPKLEYVVQDGGSSDESREVILEHAAELHAWVSEPDGGQARAINLGFQKTAGEIMGWLNADDLHVPNTLWQVGEFFLTHPQVDVVYGHRLIINEDGHLIGSWIMPSHDDEVLSWADYIPQETLFWRRSVWERAGGRLDENFHFALDWDLILRFRSAGARFHRIPKVLGCFRVHENQKTSLELGHRGKEEMEFLRQRVHGRIPSDEEIWNQIKSYLRKSIVSYWGWRALHSLKRIVLGKEKQTIIT